MQLRLPTNLEYRDGTVNGTLLKEMSRGFCGDGVNNRDITVRLVPGCVELWVPEGWHKWSELVADDAAMDALARRWLGCLDESFVAREKGRVWDPVEAWRQLDGMGCEDEGVRAALCDSAVRHGDAREAALLDVVEGVDIGPHVVVVPACGVDTAEIVMGAAHTKAAAMATAVGLGCEPGVWPLRAREALVRVRGRAGAGPQVMHGVDLVEGTVPCTYDFMDAVQREGGLIRVPGGIGVGSGVRGDRVLGTVEGDFQSLRSVVEQGVDR